MARVLYIEDNTDNRVLVRRILLFEGIAVLEAANAADGIKLAVEEKPDLILMDINMPGIDGHAATALLRNIEQIRDIPIVALTANAMRGDKEKAIEAGMDGYIQKPIDIDRFPQQVMKYLKVE
jgi:two-component system cell cycle response regulator DivK